MTSRKIPGVAFWATVGLVVVLGGYVGAYASMVEPIYFHTSAGRILGHPPGSMDPTYRGGIFRGYRSLQFCETVFSPIHWIDRRVRPETWTVQRASTDLADYIEMSPGPTMLQLSGNGSASLAMSISGIAFAAFCVWLTVRIVNRKERWAKWTLAAVIGLPVLYVASFGPACGLVDHRVLPFRHVALAYRPLIHFTWCGTNPSYLDLPCESLYQYSRLFAENSVLYCMWNETLMDTPEPTR